MRLTLLLPSTRPTHGFNRGLENSVFSLLLLTTLTHGFNGANLENNVFTMFTTIPTLVYAETKEGILEGGLLSLNKGSVSDGDVPETFYYNIDCTGTPTADVPWVHDIHVARKVEYTNCANLLKQTTIQVATKYDMRLPIVSRPLVPIPRTMVWKGYTMESNNPGDPYNRLSRCCTPSGCPEICLKNTAGKRCTLNIQALEIETTWMSVEDGFKESITKSGTIFKYLSGGGDYHNRRAVSRLVMRTPCEYCPLVNCVTNCTNGEVCVVHAIMMITIPVTDEERASLPRDTRITWCVSNSCHVLALFPRADTYSRERRTGSRPREWNAGRAPRGPGTRAWERQAVSGKPRLLLVPVVVVAPCHVSFLVWLRQEHTRLGQREAGQHRGRYLPYTWRPR